MTPTRSPRHRDASPTDNEAAPKLPRIITHQNLDPILDAVAALPCMQLGPAGKNVPRPGWLDQEVVLEVPLGELAEDGLKALALAGWTSPAVLELTGQEGFRAQGLEGKVQIRKSLCTALFNLRDLIPPYRGRILTEVVK